MRRADRKLVAKFPGIRRAPSDCAVGRSIAAGVEPDGYVLLTGKVSARRRFVVSGDLVVLLVDGAGGWCSTNRTCFFFHKACARDGGRHRFIPHRLQNRCEA